MKSLTRFGVNLQFIEADTLLQDGDELVLMPPSAADKSLFPSATCRDYLPA